MGTGRGIEEHEIGNLLAGLLRVKIGVRLFSNAIMMMTDTFNTILDYAKSYITSKIDQNSWPINQ